MKKTLLLLTLTSYPLLLLHAQSAQPPTINPIPLLKELNINIADLPLRSHARIITGTCLGTASGYILALALANLLGYNKRPEFFRPPTQWTKAEVLGGTIGGYLGAKLNYESEMPSYQIKHLNTPLLELVLSTKEYDQTFFHKLSVMFAQERFSLMATFHELTRIISTFSGIKTLLQAIDQNKYRYIIHLLDHTVNHVNLALIALKNQTSWLAENNAYTLNNLHITAQSSNNAQTAYFAAALAHSGSQ